MPTEKIFSNQFANPKITSLRFANFAKDSLNRFKTIAVGEEFVPTITAITAALANLEKELGEVDSSLNNQKLKTYKVRQFLKTFKITMRAAESIVVLRTGSKNSDLYRMLFPKGIKEYSNVNNTKMPILMHRVNDVVNRFDNMLGGELSAKLSALKTDWEAVRNSQEQKMAEVNESRTERTAARRALEIVMTKAVHAVALSYPGDVDKCNKFFNFRLLFGTRHHHEEGRNEAEKGSVSETGQVATLATDQTPVQETVATPVSRYIDQVF